MPSRYSALASEEVDVHDGCALGLRSTTSLVVVMERLGLRCLRRSRGIAIDASPCHCWSWGDLKQGTCRQVLS